MITAKHQNYSNITRKFMLVILLLINFLAAKSQDQILLVNPSFDFNTAAMSQAPKLWHGCSPAGESPPDVHSAESNFFNVNQFPAHGDFFLGMVVRDNNTWEGVSQQLKQSLEKNQAYQFKISLSRTQYYISLSRSTGEERNYNIPTILQLWGGNTPCEREELLFKSEAIDHYDWKEYTIEFQPSSDWKYLTIEAYYSLEGSPMDFNGNLLLDNCSAITEIDSLNNSTTTKINNVLFTHEKKLYKPVPKQNAFHSLPYVFAELDKRNIDLTDPALQHLSRIKSMEDINKVLKKEELDRQPKSLEDLTQLIDDFERDSTLNIIESFKSLKKVRLGKNYDKRTTIKQMHDKYAKYYKTEIQNEIDSLGIPSNGFRISGNNRAKIDENKRYVKSVEAAIMNSGKLDITKTDSTLPHVSRIKSMIYLNKVLSRNRLDRKPKFKKDLTQWIDDFEQNRTMDIVKSFKSLKTIRKTKDFRYRATIQMLLDRYVIKNKYAIEKEFEILGIEL